MPSRREVLALSAALSLVPLARLGAATQVVGVYRRGVGEITVTALLDGVLGLHPDQLLSGSDPETNARLLRAAFVAGPAIDTSINAYVIETAGRTLVVDGGAAGAFGPTAGNLPAALAAAGVAPEAVDTLVCSHLHPDHVGAFTTADGAAAFPNAELRLHPAEHGFWTDPANFAGADDQTLAFAQMARAAVAPYADRLHLTEDGGELAPGVSLVHLPGHTPGHSGVMVSSAGQELLLWADIVHIGPIQFARPAVTIAFDVDQPLAAATRARVLDRVATDRVEIAGAHIDFPSFGHVEAVGTGYRFVPSRWDHQL